MEIAASIGMILSPEQGQQFLQDMGLDLDMPTVTKTKVPANEHVNLRDLAGTVDGKRVAQFLQGGTHPEKQSKVKGPNNGRD